MKYGITTLFAVTTLVCLLSSRVQAETKEECLADCTATFNTCDANVNSGGQMSAMAALLGSVCSDNQDECNADCENEARREVQMRILERVVTEQRALRAKETRSENRELLRQLLIRTIDEE